MRNPFAFAHQQLSDRRNTGRRASVWNGASTSRLYSDWEAWTLSPDIEIRAQFRILRARARDLAKNNPWCTGFVDEIANNVVGQSGIMLQANVKGLDGKPVKALNRNIERAFGEWGMPEYASADGHDSFVELQRLMIQTVAIDGECLVRRLRGFDNPFGYSVQLIDVDLLDEMYNVPAGNGQNQIKMGVEVDRWNRPVAYHIWNRYGEDMSGIARKRERIPAEEIIHLFVRYRPNQTRGITWFAPILTSVKHLDGYELNELVATRVAAAKMGFIVNKNPDAIAAFEWPDKHEPKTMDAEPGIVSELLPGQEFQGFDPNHPSGQYEMFTSTVLLAIARGLRVSYLTLTGDPKRANYSSMRAAFEPERYRWRCLQEWMGTHCVRVVYRDWIDMATLKRALDVPSLLGSDYYGVVFKGRGWKYVDPVKDLDAAEKEVRMGTNSLRRLAAEQGRDYEEIIEERRDDEAFAREEGVTLLTDEPVKPSADPARDVQNGNAGETDNLNDRTDGANAADADRPRMVAL